MTKNNDITKYDKRDNFENDCRELLEKLILQCSLNNIPFFFTAATKNDEHGTVYESDLVGVGSKSIKLKDDKISKHIAVQTGFDVIPHREELEVEMNSTLLFRFECRLGN